MRVNSSIELRPKALLNLALVLATITIGLLIFKDSHSSSKKFALPLPVFDSDEVDLRDGPVLERPVLPRNSPGDYGKAVEISDKDLSSDEKIEKERLLKKYQINHFVSDKISLHRHPGDHRNSKCHGLTYPSNLPTTSVIIAFYNEHWTTLMRTIYSVLHESNKSILKEIILIDDKSDQPHLAEPLEKALKDVPRVRLIRSKKREGLVRARLLGMSYATGEVLTFLDCHIECNPGWLEPLLYEIQKNPKAITVPVITTISWDNFAFHGPGTNPQIGGFDWRMTFQWHSIPEHEMQRRNHSTDPIRSPTMAGGLFAIGRDWFEYLGTYDMGMEIWGGENLELSWRNWMCDGELLIVPCSVVGHVFPKVSKNFRAPKLIKILSIPGSSIFTAVIYRKHSSCG